MDPKIFLAKARILTHILLRIQIVQFQKPSVMYFWQKYLRTISLKIFLKFRIRRIIVIQNRYSKYYSKGWGSVSVDLFYITTKVFSLSYKTGILKDIGIWRAWILDVMLIALVSKVTLLVWLSNFAQCWLRLNPVAQIPWAPRTVQILKVTLIEWLLKLTLLALHQVFTPIVI